MNEPVLQKDKSVLCGGKFSRVVPLWKFALLSLVTFGVYEFVWFYKNWKLLNKEGELNISPFWRTFFAPFFAVSLAGNLQKYLKSKNVTCDYSPRVVGIGYLFIFSLWKLPDPYWLISSFSFIPLLLLVNSMNTYWMKEEGEELPLKEFDWWQVILIAVGMIWLILVIIGAFIPE